MDLGRFTQMNSLKIKRIILIGIIFLTTDPMLQHNVISTHIIFYELYYCHLYACCELYNQCVQ